MVIDNTFSPSASEVLPSASSEQDFKTSRRSSVIHVLLRIVSDSKQYRLGNVFQMEIFIS